MFSEIRIRTDGSTGIYSRGISRGTNTAAKPRTPILVHISQPSAAASTTQNKDGGNKMCDEVCQLTEFRSDEIIVLVSGLNKASCIIKDMIDEMMSIRPESP